MDYSTEIDTSPFNWLTGNKSLIKTFLSSHKVVLVKTIEFSMQVVGEKEFLEAVFQKIPEDSPIMDFNFPGIPPWMNLHHDKASHLLNLIFHKLRFCIPSLLQEISRKMEANIVNELTKAIRLNWLQQITEDKKEFLPNYSTQVYLAFTTKKEKEDEKMIQVILPYFKHFQQAPFFLERIGRMGHFEIVKTALPSESLTGLLSSFLSFQDEEGKFTSGKKKLLQLLERDEKVETEVLLCSHNLYKRNLEFDLFHNSLRTGENYSWHFLPKLMAKIIREIQLLHASNIVYGFVTPWNIFQEFLEVRFGVPHLSENIEVFRAPEEEGLNFMELTKKGDIFSVGVLILQLLTERELHQEDKGLIIQDVTNVCPRLREYKTLRRIIQQLVNPLSERMTSEEFQNLLVSVDWKELELDVQTLNPHKVLLIEQSKMVPELETLMAMSEEKVAIQTFEEVVGELTQLLELISEDEKEKLVKEVLSSRGFADLNEYEEENVSFSSTEEFLEYLKERPSLIPQLFAYMMRCLPRPRTFQMYSFLSLIVTTMNDIWLLGFGGRDILGKGDFGQVLKSLRKGFPPHHSTALKIVFPPGNQIAMVEREIEILQSLNHPNIVGGFHSVRRKAFSSKDLQSWVKKDDTNRGQIYSSSLSESFSSCFSYSESSESNDIRIGYVISMSLCGHSLQTWLNDTFNNRKIGKISVVTFSLKIVRGILRGMRYLLQNNVLHKDLKPINILFSQRLKEDEYPLPVKIADFGLSKFADRVTENGETSLEGNWRFKAPEVFAGESQTKSSEIYSVGMILLVVIAPLQGKDVREVAKSFSRIWKEKVGSFSEDCEELFLFETISKMLENDKEKRLSFEDFYKLDVDWDLLRPGILHFILEKLIDKKYRSGDLY